MKKLDQNKQRIYFDRFHTDALNSNQLTFQNVLSWATSKVRRLSPSNLILLCLCDISFWYNYISEIKSSIHDDAMNLNDKCFSRHQFVQKSTTCSSECKCGEGAIHGCAASTLDGVLSSSLMPLMFSPLADGQDKLLKRRVAGLCTYVLVADAYVHTLLCFLYQNHLDTATIKHRSTYRYWEALRHDTHSYDNSNKTHHEINNK